MEKAERANWQGAVPCTPATKEKMTFVESSYIAERFTSHKRVPALAIFPFSKTVVDAFVIKSESIEVWFATHTCFGVTKQHYFVTNTVCFVTNKVCFVTNKVYFVTKQSLLPDKQSLLRHKQSLLCDNKVCFVTNKVYFVTNKVCFCDKQSSLRDKQSLLCDKQTLLRGKATFLSYEEALLGRRNTYKHQPLNKRRTYHGHKHIRVRLSFTHESDHQIEETTGAVITGMTGNKNYPNPPVDLAEVQAALTVSPLPLGLCLRPSTFGRGFPEARRLSSRQHRRDVPLRHLSDGDASHLFH